MVTDGYALAIPIDELQAVAWEMMADCGAAPETVRRRCAAQAVHNRACPCLLETSCVLDAVASEFGRWVAEPHRVAARGRPPAPECRCVA